MKRDGFPRIIPNEEVINHAGLERIQDLAWAATTRIATEAQSLVPVPHVIAITPVPRRYPAAALTAPRLSLKISVPVVIAGALPVTVLAPIITAASFAVRFVGVSVCGFVPVVLLTASPVGHGVAWCAPLKRSALDS